MPREGKEGTHPRTHSQSAKIKLQLETPGPPALTQIHTRARAHTHMHMHMHTHTGREGRRESLTLSFRLKYSDAITAYCSLEPPGLK